MDLTLFALVMFKLNVPLSNFDIRLCQYSQEVYYTAKTCKLHYNGIIMPIKTRLSLLAMKLSLKFTS